MRDMRTGRVVMLATLASMLALGIVPLAVATTPADATIMFAPTSCAPPGCLGFGVTYMVAQNAQCPAGGVVIGTVSESGPTGSDTFTVFNPSDTSQPLPCGTALVQAIFVHPVYPNTACDVPFAGTYKFEFSGHVVLPTGAGGSSFDVKTTYVVPPCISVPQFPLGMAALFALAIPLVLAVRKWGPVPKVRSI